MRYALSARRSASKRDEVAVVSRVLGHAGLATTAGMYGHLTSAMLDGTAARTDVALDRESA
jgi:integrase